ncbi:hypothetical protein CVT24_005486 [Panaeolus cyanescens]|uniref:Uncharacterized protein n=1 Tax=Panaeolus cyanescens TaxID=181874 RepID=A0A409YC96_9AGAR|nr:hypothetical protein CVT24_005486 [Panaeolus cyanescens]
MNLNPETEGCPEPLEKIFQKVEQESMRRAQEEQQRLDSSNASVNGVTNGDSKLDLRDTTPEDDEEPTALTNTLPRAKSRRRRGSVSISRIGILPIDCNDLVSSKPSLSPTSPSHLTMAVRSPFYQAQMMNSSTTSIASGASAHSQADAHTEDDTHVTQMRHIAGKPSLSEKLKTMPRRLSRAHSATLIPTVGSLGGGGSAVGAVGGMGGMGGLVIGVSVHEKREESQCEEGEEKDGITVSRRASVSASFREGVRRQASRSTLAGVGEEARGTDEEEEAAEVPVAARGGGGWLRKAKDLTLKFRRKAMDITTPSRAPSRMSGVNAA